MGDCDKIPADAWEQLPQPVWPALQKSEGVPDFVELGGVHLSGFLCFDGDFAGITCCCAHRSALASEFFCCKDRLVANFKPGWQVALTLAPVSAPVPNIFVRPNLAASFAVILLHVTHCNSSFPCPHAQRWRSILSCDM